MNTYDKYALPPLPEGMVLEGIWVCPEDELISYRDACIQAAIEADRKRRGEPVAWPLASPEEADKGWTLDYRFIEQVERIASQHTDYTTSMEATEQVLIAANEVLRASQPAEPDKQHPDDVAVDAFAAAMKAKLKRAREEKGRGGWQDMSATELSAMLREHVEKGDPVDVANLAMMLSLNGQRIAPVEPVKPCLIVKYDEKGDSLYICCDSNEPAEAEENDQGILLWRAYSDGQLVGVTIPNFIGPYIKPVKVDAEASVPSDMDIDELSREWGLLSAAYPSKSMVRDFARALLARYK